MSIYLCVCVRFLVCVGVFVEVGGGGLQEVKLVLAYNIAGRCVCVCAPVFVCVPCWGLQAPRQVSISPIITSQSPLLLWLPPSLPLSPRVSQYKACEGDTITPKLVSRLLSWRLTGLKKPKYSFQPPFLHPSIHCTLFIHSNL